ncbi:hypothetical protein HJC23_001741 [Cyclotella cryptica]|uniref:F-box domain-containing protein n=1 Tax=Cyclotella cryptica TaxID=29204 RepID=A0ABD3QP47_9STRA|eukprot:CCRYP_003294-RA/>CCRYP_003294-RA protein AED:0.04 eAED:-0.04 QI:0/-1/0/1/-1/1/1/0/548
MLLNLPQDAWSSISLHLCTPDVLALLSTHRTINQFLSSSPSFWTQLLARDRDESYDNESNHGRRCVQDIRREFMLHSYTSALPSVKWLPLNINRTFPVSPREGHVSCVLTGPENYKSLVVTGGFCDDDYVTVLSLPRGCDSHRQNWGWTRLRPINRASFAYGASLTALPPIDSGSATVNIAKAVRFGGFRGGGYSQETNEVWVLTIRDEWNEESGASQTAHWEKIETTGAFLPLGRAYHTATLIHDRYLVIIGGMTSEGSVMEEAILDTQTWTWNDISLATTGYPRGRHGHSVVLDGRRNRLVMFGGGSGTDLLRSGVDNTEVWELKMRGIEVPINLDNSRLWEWSKLHGNAIPVENRSESGDDSDSEDDEMKDASNYNPENDLSPAESLCLGRCHNGLKVSPDTVLLMFGGGRTNTNGVLAYNLRADTFFRPKVLGPLPLPRFTGIASFLDTEGYVFVHGGFNTNLSDTIHDIHLLDVAPYLERDFTALPVDRLRESNSAVTDEDAESGHYVVRGFLDEAVLARFVWGASWERLVFEGGEGERSRGR